MKIIVVIPARYDSTRFPGKVLAKETGKYLIQHTWEQVRKAAIVEKVIIATNSEKVLSACKSFGADCVMTSASHQSGTDRIAEAVEKIDTDVVINVQADEPEIEPSNIELLAQLMIDNPQAKMATLVAKFENKEQIANPSIVKVIIGKDRFAKYFSRSVIPCCRKNGPVGDINDYYRHLGIYAYTKDFLLHITKLPAGKLEQIEQLEQLRVLEYGFEILTGFVKHIAPGIDTQEQYLEFVKRVKK
ncbi:MAG: 3-deoxy-manno-octulosonate cytidylyltransferase [Planctomycetes bacterium]|nr:3-deoxy-manno-octulosonate cytidylyltransferase [Planctomycetota bacterium]MBU1518443.1 3-deoxy-manno-octulosonate cytidylyltransferase [Planctomycetota bacterium]MBU2458039.1 3-deoxy-manno-octulosonate cytidylyltransferase [Planctomycetota bacterium]